MAGPVGDERAAVRRRRLRQPGQGVELAHDADHRLALAEGCDEPGRLAGDARLDPKARRGELTLQQRRALIFLVAELGMVPDRLGRRGKMRGALVDERKNILVPRRLGDRRAGEQQRGQRDGEFPQVNVRIHDASSKSARDAIAG
jgi:hypothetical protein